MTSPSPIQFNPERRRQWVIGRGLVSPTPGPTRRLGGLLPRVGLSSSSPTPNPVDMRPRPGAQSAPVTVSRASIDHSLPSSVPRAVSMPSAEAQSGPSVERAATTRTADRPSSPPRRRRFLMRRNGRKGRRTSRFGDEPVERRERVRAVYTNADRESPRNVSQGDATFDGTTWKDYSDRMDRLAEDEGFMEYLTAPVKQRHQIPLNREPRIDAEFEVNKLYPLAFIRLLEAHAKHASETSEPCDPAEELHRYDDLDCDGEDRVERTQSSGLYDMGRFRTVGGSPARTSPFSGTTTNSFRTSVDYTQYVQERAPVREEKRRMYHGNFLSRMGRESRTVPVC